MNAWRNLTRVLAEGALPQRFSGYQREPILALPKTIHFIWIGSPLPDKYRANVVSYVRHNPTFAIHLWTDRETAPVDGVTVQPITETVRIASDLYYAEHNMGAKADIARYEIVHREGGIYCDIDSVALRPFDETFDTAFVPIELQTWKNVNNAIFGFPRGSTFLAFVLDCLRHTRSETMVERRTGPTFFTTCFVSADDDRIRTLPHAVVNRDMASYTFHSNDANWLR